MVQTCPDPITLVVPDGQSCVEATWPEPVVTDNSGIVNIDFQTLQQNTCLGIGLETVVYAFSDPAGNAAFCVFTISVEAGLCLYIIIRWFKRIMQQAVSHCLVCSNVVDPLVWCEYCTPRNSQIIFTSAACFRHVETLYPVMAALPPSSCKQYFRWYIPIQQHYFKVPPLLQVIDYKLLGVLNVSLTIWFSLYIFRHSSIFMYL